MDASWDARVEQFWDRADDAHPDRMLADMGRLVAELPEGHPDALFEWASVHDYLGREAEAVPLYRAALAAGLSGGREPQAVIQLASSLRNIGETRAAIRLLEDRRADGDGGGGDGGDATGAAAQAFLALALYDSGRADEALRVALKALAPTLPMYSRAVSAYADELVSGDATAR